MDSTELQTLITAAVLIALIVSLYRNWVKPFVAFGGAVCVFLMFNVLTPEEALSGFANENVAVIILLLIVSSLIRKAGIIDHGLNTVFQNTSHPQKFMAKMMAFVSVISGFLNNTPVVAAFMPYVFTWAKRNKVAPSKLLLPLSYAAILGGTLTLIGTSTNLIVNGLAKEYGFFGFSLFDFAFVGIPFVVVGCLYLWLFGNRILPEVRDALDSFADRTREYVVEARVQDGSILADRTVSDAQLRNLKGLFLVEIVRGDRQIGPVRPSQNIREGDYLIFAGDTETIPELLNSNLGLELPKLRDIPKQEHIDVVEAVVAPNSILAGKKVRDTNFRGAYDAAIVGVHRNGERLTGKIGDLELKTGDLLVLMTGRDFRKRVDHKSFYVLSRIQEISNLDKKKAWGLTLGAAAAILASALGTISLFKALVAFITLALLFRLVRPGEIQRNLDVNLAVIAALAISVGCAMSNSGLAALVGNSITSVAQEIGPVGLICVVYIITNLLTEFVTNVAAATITLPIAITIANDLHLNIEPFILTVAFAASASFLTPIGYQTNLMVFGPGGYKFKDYLKLGLPLTLICMILVVTILTITYKLY